MTADLDTFDAACRAADAKLAAVDSQSSEPEIERLAKLPRLEYERQREDTARLLGVRVAALDKIVREQRTAAEDDAATLPHWTVEPSPEPVDGAALLDRFRQVFRRYIVLPKGVRCSLAVVGAARVDLRRRRDLAVHGAGVAGQAVRQNLCVDSSVLPDAQIRAGEQHLADRHLPIHR